MYFNNGHCHADAKVKELENSAYEGRRQSFDEPGLALHEEPGAYAPQVQQSLFSQLLLLVASCSWCFSAVFVNAYKICVCATTGSCKWQARDQDPTVLPVWLE